MIDLFDNSAPKMIGTLALGILIGFSIGNGHTTQSAISSVSDQLGQQRTVAVTATKAAGCEKWRAEVSQDVAKQAINSAVVADAVAPSPSALPADNCPRPAKK